jgi:hypothetical protein
MPERKPPTLKDLIPVESYDEEWQVVIFEDEGTERTVSVQHLTKRVMAMLHLNDIEMSTEFFDDGNLSVTQYALQLEVDAPHYAAYYPYDKGPLKTTLEADEVHQILRIRLDTPLAFGMDALEPLLRILNEYNIDFYGSSFAALVQESDLYEDIEPGKEVKVVVDACLDGYKDNFGIIDINRAMHRLTSRVIMHCPEIHQRIQKILDDRYRY